MGYENKAGCVCFQVIAFIYVALHDHFCPVYFILIITAIIKGSFLILISHTCWLLHMEGYMTDQTVTGTLVMQEKDPMEFCAYDTL